MSITIPTWTLVCAASAFPFLFAWMMAGWAERRSGFMDFGTPLIAFGIWAVVSSICWTAVIMWLFLRG